MKRNEGVKVLKNEKGITLIEIMAATAILGILVIGFLNLTHFNAKAKQEENRRAEALKIAEDQLNIKRGFYNSNPTDVLVTGNKVISNTTQGLYQVLIQLSDLQNSPGYIAPTYAKQVYVQSVVLVQNASNPSVMVPRLITVTVSWSG